MGRTFPGFQRLMMQYYGVKSITGPRQIMNTYRMLEHGPLSPLTRQKEINRSMGGDAFRTGRRHKQSVVAVSFETETDAS